MLRPGVHEHEVVARGAAAPVRAGLGARRGDQRRLGRPLQPASARLLRPAAPAGRPGVLRRDPLVHGLPHLLLPHVQRRRDLAVAARRVQAVPRVARRRDRARPARRRRPTRSPRSGRPPRSSGFPSEEACFGLQFGHGVGVGLYEPPMISRRPLLRRARSSSRRGWSSRSRPTAPPPTAARPPGSRRRSSSRRTATEVITRFPAEELLVAGKTYVRGADLLDASDPPTSAMHVPARPPRGDRARAGAARAEQRADAGRCSIGGRHRRDAHRAHAGRARGRARRTTHLHSFESSFYVLVGRARCCISTAAGCGSSRVPAARSRSGVPHAWRSEGRPEWIEMALAAAARRRPAAGHVLPRPGARRRAGAPLDLRDPRNRNLFHLLGRRHGRRGG